MKSTLSILDHSPAQKGKVKTILDKGQAEAIAEATDQSILVPSKSYMFAEIISKGMDIDECELYHRETLSLGSATAGEVEVFDTDHRTSGKYITNIEKLGEAEKNTVYFIEKIGIKYCADLGHDEVQRLEEEARLVLAFEGTPCFERKLGHLGGFGGYETKFKRIWAGAGASAGADTIIFHKGKPTLLKKLIKLPPATPWRWYLDIAGTVSTALAGDIELLLIGYRGKIKKSA